MKLKKRKWRKLQLKNVLLLGLCFGLALTGCSSKSNEEGEGGAIPQDENGRYKSTLTVSTVRYVSSTMEAALAQTENAETSKNNRYNDLFREKLNIELEYDWISDSSNYIEKVDMALVASNIPDFMAVTVAQVKQLYEAGLIWDMTDVYKDYATEQARYYMEMQGQGDFEAVTYDGKLMAIPSTWGSYDKAQFIWIRHDWLENLGLSEPTCMEDVVNIAYAFAKQDPDKNGKDDTIGLGMCNDFTNSVGGLIGFFNGYGAYINTWLRDDDGKLVYADIQPEVETALTQLNKMYADGVIARDFGTTNSNALISKCTAGNCGMFYGEHWMSMNLQYSVDMNPDADWRPYSLVGLTPDTTPKNQVANGTTYFWVASKECANPEAIMKMINLMWDLDPYYKSSADAPEAWWFSPIQVQNPRINLDQWENVQSLLAGGEGDTTEQRWTQIDAYQKGDSYMWQIWMIYGSPYCSMSILDTYLERDMLMPSAFSGAPTKTMASAEGVLYTLRGTEFTKMITQGNVSSLFQDYVKNWKQLGGDEMTKEVNEAKGN